MGDLLDDSGGGGAPSAGKILKKGVVVEVLYGPGVFGPEMQAQLKATVGLNKEQYDRLSTAPRNSCIVRQYGEGKGTDQTTQLVFPFFPPHLCFPVKPGECVWLITPGVNELDPKESFWISRIPSTSIIDDPNYTHVPREKTTSNQPLPSSQKASGVYGLPNFSNFGDPPPSKKPILAPPTGSSDVDPPNTFNLIVEESVSYPNFTPQPVPRFSKRIGDFVIQGSNNTLISLGEDRGWKYTDTDVESRQTSNAVKHEGQELEFAGTIDIVAGRSRILPETQTAVDAEGDAPVGTGFRTIDNSREYIENDKNPLLNEFVHNPYTEGDPDFRTDAARIYVSMKTSGDMNFGLNRDETAPGVWVEGSDFVPGTPGDDSTGSDPEDATPGELETQSTPGGAESRMATGFEAAIEPIADAAYVIAKADEVRLVARKQEVDQYVVGATEINGSIRLVKEGACDEDHATICLLPDGTIQISGAKIYIGRHEDDGGRGAGPAAGNSEPYVRYSDLKTLWEEVMDELVTFCETLETNTTPGYGSPSVQIVNAAVALRTAIDTAGEGHKKNIDTVQSERIFGE